MALLDDIRERTRQGVQLFTWVAVMDRHVCDGPATTLSNGATVTGCLGRHLQKQTNADWTADGVPTAAGTYCGDNCRCVMVPSDVISIGTDSEISGAPGGEGGILRPIDLSALAAAAAPRKPLEAVPAIPAIPLTVPPDDAPGIFRILALGARLGIKRPMLTRRAKEIAGSAPVRAAHYRQALAELRREGKIK